MIEGIEGLVVVKILLPSGSFLRLTICNMCIWWIGNLIGFYYREEVKGGMVFLIIRGVPAVLFIEGSSFQGVLIRGVPAVLFIEVSSFQGVLIRGVPAVLFIEVSSFQGVLIRGVPALLFIELS